MALIHSDASIASGVIDEFDERANSISYLLFCDGSAGGTIRASVYSAEFEWQSIPATATYEEVIHKVLGHKVPVLQSSHFALLPEHRTLSWTPKALLYRALLATAAEHKVEFIVTIVRDRRTQLRFYAKLGFQPIAPPRVHAPVSRMGVLLLTTTQDFSRWVDDQLT